MIDALFGVLHALHPIDILIGVVSFLVGITFPFRTTLRSGVYFLQASLLLLRVVKQVYAHNQAAYRRLDARYDKALDTIRSKTLTMYQAHRQKRHKLMTSEETGAIG